MKNSINCNPDDSSPLFNSMNAAEIQENIAKSIQVSNSQLETSLKFSRIKLLQLKPKLVAATLLLNTMMADLNHIADRINLIKTKSKN